MKKQLLTIFTLAIGTLTFAQVGVNTANPEASFDITAKTTTGTSTEGLLVPRVDRLKAQSMTNIPNSTLIYVNSIANGTLAGNAVNINSEGYYFYNGTAWSKLLDTNLYNSDGILTGNRIVTQGANTLSFNPTTNNGFSIKGSLFSVDAAANRIGIGTTTPTAPFELRTTLNGITPMQIFQPVKTTATPGIRIVSTGATPDIGQMATIGFNPNSTWGNTPIVVGASYLTAPTGEASADFIVGTSIGGPAIIKFVVKNNGATGILTTTPQRTLHVAGSLQVTNELNVGGNGTTAGSAGTTGQVLVSNGAGNAPSWQTPSGTGTEVDGVIGNEVLNATVGGALERSGAGTAADPYTLGVADQGITTAKIADNSVTYAKINTPVKAITTNYTLLAEDSGGFIYSSGTTALTVTVPDTLPIGFHCVIIQQGTGQVTAAQGGTLTLNSARGTKTRARYSAIGIVKHGAGTAVVTGDAVN